MRGPRKIGKTTKVLQELGNVVSGISARDEVYYQAYKWVCEFEQRLRYDALDDTLGKLRLGVDKPNCRFIQHIIIADQTVFKCVIEVSFDVADDDESVEIVEILFAEIEG